MKYKGILAKPRLYSDTHGLLPPKQLREALKAKERAEDTARLLELYRVHGITPYDWKGLAMALARAHVGGMQVEKARRGSPLKWSPFSRVVLRFNVDQFADHHDVPITKACEELAKCEPYKSKLENKKNREPKLTGERNRESTLTSERRMGKALRKQYNLIDPRWIKVLDDARSDGQLDPARGKQARGLSTTAKPALRRQNR